MRRSFHEYDQTSNVVQPVVYLSFESQIKKFLEQGQSDFSAPPDNAYDFPSGEDVDFDKQLAPTEQDLFELNVNNDSPAPQANNSPAPQANIDNSNNSNPSKDV